MKPLLRLLALGTLRIKSYKQEKYGRWLADIYVQPSDGSAEIWVNDTLVKEGFAVPYFGEGPKT